tara:strand:+ start:6859 stop:8631 length:1773 start_codon:yes stop_codon:yes gene_type:complete
MEVPDGGLASFLSATVGDWADTPENVPVTGIGGIRSVADKLAEYGRYEDTYMVHAAQGETVIPMAVFDENPRLKESLFAQMREMGVDPEQYVVGNELNSINPVTGQPEFFLKKLFKGLKKAVKSVVKVIKKVAPIVLSIGLSMTPLGLIAGSALGSGIGTLIQGGSLKDALKMGAIGGLTAGLFKGVTGAIGSKIGGGTLGEGFKAGIQSGLPDAVRASQAAALNQAATQGTQALLPPPVAPAGSLTVNPAANTVMGPIQASSSGVNVPAKYANIPSVTATAPAPAVATTVMTPLNTDLFAQGTTTPGMGVGVTANSSTVVPNAAGSVTAAGEAAGEAASGTAVGTQAAVPQGIETLTEAQLTELKTPGFAESLKDMFVDTGSDKGFLEAGRDAFFPGKVSPQALVREQLGVLPNAGTDAMNAAIQERGITKTLQELITDATTQIAQDNMNPGFLRRFAPGIAAGTGILGLTGGFETPEMEEAGDPFGMGGKSGFDLIDEDPNQYRMFAQGAPYFVPIGTSATGGTIDHFPRKNGAIAGPGTGTSDDIPAMLSDGEFVMTAQAVRGAGNGDRRQGVKRMYDVMRSFEGVA